MPQFEIAGSEEGIERAQFVLLNSWGQRCLRLDASHGIIGGIVSVIAVRWRRGMLRRSRLVN